MGTTHTGACLCNGIRFTIEGELAPIQVCHCSLCRRAQGGPFATNIPVETQKLTWHSGHDLMRRYESSPGKFRVFCSACGSPLFSERTKLPGIIRLRAGLLSEPVKTVIGFHIYANSQVNWWPPQDDLPRHPEGHTG